MKTKKYPKIYRKGSEKCPNFEKEELVTVQEKLDGSNITIDVYRNKTIKIYSRTGEIITPDQQKQWRLLLNIIYKQKDKILNTMEEVFFNREDKHFNNIESVRIHGEFLTHRKVNYKHTVRNKLYIIDIRISYGEGHKDNLFLTPDLVDVISKKINLPRVPVIFVGKYGDINIDTISQGMSLIDPNVEREGVVIKSNKGKNYKTMKIVNTKFEEMKAKKKDKPQISIQGTLANEIRIEKFIFKLEEVGLDTTNKSILYKNTISLITDFIEEEMDGLIKTLRSAINKKISKELQEYIKKNIDNKK